MTPKEKAMKYLDDSDVTSGYMGSFPEVERAIDIALEEQAKNTKEKFVKPEFDCPFNKDCSKGEQARWQWLEERIKKPKSLGISYGQKQIWELIKEARRK